MTTSSPLHNLPSFACWHNGAVVAPEQAMVPVFDHGLLYGDGAFEGLRFYNNRAFRPHLHTKRLSQSLKALSLDIPYSSEQLLDGIQQAIDACEVKDGYIRIIVTRGVGPLGLNPVQCPKPSVFVIASVLELVDDATRDKGVNLITASIKRMTGTGLDPRIKSLNYLPSVLARIEANAAGADEALLLNQHGFVAECSAQNLFLFADNKLKTPKLADGPLSGITRATVIELAELMGVQVEETSLTQYDVYNAEEVFLTGSGARLIPVREVDGRQIQNCPGVAYQQIGAAFSKLIEQECSDSAPVEQGITLTIEPSY